MRDTPTRVHGPAINVTFSTARLRLEPIDSRHAAALFEGLLDPAVNQWISLQPSPDLAHLQARWARVAQRPLAGVDVLDFGWAVQRIADGAWIGKMDAEVTAAGVATNVGYAFASVYRAAATAPRPWPRSASTCGATA